MSSLPLLRLRLPISLLLLLLLLASPCSSAFVASPPAAAAATATRHPFLTASSAAQVTLGAPHLISDAKPDAANNIGESTVSCTRILSAEAAELIGSSDEPLVITTDASGGSGRFHGLCALLRQVGAASSSDMSSNDDQNTDLVSIFTRRTRAIQQCTGKRKSRTRRSSRALRISKSSVLGIPAEISAASLGIRAALDHVTKERRSQVLLLVDCERSLNYLCGGLYNRYDAFGRALEAVANETASGTIFISTVASVSKSRYDGFFDHAAADYIAGMARSRPNTDTATTAVGIEIEEHCCPALKKTDLEWLASSDTTNDMVDTCTATSISGEEKVTSIAQRREEGKMRIDRLLQRIEVDLLGCDPL